jgi:hypothetical protein
VRWYRRRPRGGVTCGEGGGLRGAHGEREREVVGMCEREMVSYDPGTEESKEAQ